MTYVQYSVLYMYVHFMTLFPAYIFHECIPWHCLLYIFYWHCSLCTFSWHSLLCRLPGTVPCARFPGQSPLCNVSCAVQYFECFFLAQFITTYPGFAHEGLSLIRFIVYIFIEQFSRFISWYSSFFRFPSKVHSVRPLTRQCKHSLAKFIVYTLLHNELLKLPGIARGLNL